MVINLSKNHCLKMRKKPFLTAPISLTYFFIQYFPIFSGVYLRHFIHNRVCPKLFSFVNALILVNITACQRHRTRALGLAGNPPPGTYVPHCRPDGSYDDVQCHGYTGLCWCVDEKGNEILGTRKWERPHCGRLPPGRRIIESIELISCVATNQ